jgi:class 3 adenylate cyclase
MTSTERQLKAIMFSDVKSFSAMMAANEERTMRLIKEHREIVRGILARHGGEEHGTAGDSFFVLFASAVKAVQCAVEIQEAFHRRNAGRPAEEQIWIRIGIHIGDIIVDESDHHVYGEGINIAARTEPKAEPGGICITQDVFQQVRNKIDLKVISIGRQEMKNIVDAPELFKIIVGQVGESGAVEQKPLTSASVVPRRASGLVVVAIVAVLLIAVGAVLLLVLRESGEDARQKPVTKADRTAHMAGVARPAPPPDAGVTEATKPAAVPATAIDAQLPGRVFVNRIAAPEEYSGTAKIVADMIASRFSRHYRDGVLTYAEAQSTQGIEALSKSAAEDGSRAPLELAKLVKADVVVFGELTKIPGGAWVSVAIFDVGQNRVTHRVSERCGDSPEEIMRAVERGSSGLDAIFTVPVKKDGAEVKEIELVKSAVDSRFGLVKHCYERQLVKKPKLGGKLVIRFTLSERGSFEDVLVVEDQSSLRDKAVATCITETFDHLETGYRFSGSTTFDYPFLFEPRAN